MRFRRRRLAAAIAALTLLGSAAVTAVGMSSSSAAAKNGETYFNIVSYNIFNGINNDRTVDAINRLQKRDIDVMALQEISSDSRRKAIRQRLVDCASCTLDIWMPDKRPGEGVDPILWDRTRFALVAGGSNFAVGRTHVGATGAGGSTTVNKYVTWVKLRDRTSGQMFVVVNNHLVASVEDRRGPNNNHARQAVYGKQMDELQRTVRALHKDGTPVFVAGDFNVNFRKDVATKHPSFPLRKLEAIDMKSTYDVLGAPKGGTHGRRLIDYIFFSLDRDVAIMGQEILDGYPSDHKPVAVRVYLP